MKAISALLATLFLSSICFAETTTYQVEGMHCGSCAKAIKAQVCKMEGLAACDVTVGQVVITPKEGVKIPQEQIQSAISKAGEYKITGSQNAK